MTIQEWLELVKTKKANCYIKPTRRTHDSGFRVFEVGYCTINEKHKVNDKIVLGEYTDHVWVSPLHPVKDLSMDLTMDGYIRLFGFGDDPLVWEYGGDYVLSTAQIQPLSSVRGIRG